MVANIAWIVAVPLLVGILHAPGALAEEAHGDEPDEGISAVAGDEGEVIRANAVDLRSLPALQDVLSELRTKQAVFVGENHDQYSHHLVQLAVVKDMFEHHPDMVIGMEFFQQPFQEHLDDYIEGRIDEAAMLRKTEYFTRWRYDYRFYRPILRFAREHGIRVIALNVAEELTKKVASGGLEALTEEEKKRIPDDIDRADQQYRERLREIFEHHPEPEERNFENFVEAQLLWDESMAARAADWFRKRPEGHMVILAGSGHIAYGAGIPNRLTRRVPISSAIVLNGVQDELSPELADFLLLPEPRELPRGGRLGIFIDDSGERLAVQGFEDGSLAEKAGVEEGDLLTSINDQPIRSMADLRIAMLKEMPGEEVTLEVLRPNLLAADERKAFRVELR